MSDGDQGLAPGEVFASYQIVRKLGEGAFGVVYEALRQPLGKRVALKVLRRALATDHDITRRFLREAQMTAQIRHPHVVETFDVGAHDGTPYLAMEFLEGEPLSSRLARDRRLSPEAAIDVMIPVLSAMATVHEHGVVHRDLKPDNIFLLRARGGQVFPKVLDFGIAKGDMQGKGMALTRTSTLLGTPFYMSPEQSRESKHIDARSDQWALGVIFYECLTGVRPFPGESLIEVLMKISAGTFVPPAQLCPDAPREVVAVLERMLQVDPAQRFPDVRAVALALLPAASAATRARWSDDLTHAPESLVPALAASGALAVPAPAQSTLAPRESAAPPSVTGGAGTGPRGRTWIVPVAALAAAVLTLGGWTLLRGSGAPATPPPSAVRAPARFRVATRVIPETAALALDREAPVTGAIDRELARDGRAHRLIATAPGYQRAELEFRDGFATSEIVLVRDALPAVVAVAPPVAAPVAAEAETEAAPGARQRRRSRRHPSAEPGAGPGAELGANGVTIR